MRIAFRLVSDGV